MPRVEVELWMKSPPEPIYRLLSDMERFPQFMRSVESLTVLERGEGYTVSEWVARLQGARFRWVERDQFEPDRITYKQQSGDLKQFEGAWELMPEGEGTRVRLITEFEFGMPMLAALLNPVARVTLRDNAMAMLRAVREQVEP